MLRGKDDDEGKKNVLAVRVGRSDAREAVDLQKATADRLTKAGGIALSSNPISRATIDSFRDPPTEKCRQKETDRQESGKEEAQTALLSYAAVVSTFARRKHENDRNPNWYGMLRVVTSE
ncbi:MAG: hypothetical protein IIC51_06085 [Planctomycetes bacterium]|nr:hypothetical protein [Planctomycetota bacterium]